MRWSARGSPYGNGQAKAGWNPKLAGIAATYATEVIRQPSRAEAGLIKVTVQKDRHGHVRSHAQGGVIALAHIIPSDDGAHVSVLLDPPDASTTESGEFRPTVLMAKVARYLEDEPGASRNAVIRDVIGKRAYLDDALRLLISEGNVDRRKEGQAHRHYIVHAFDENAPAPTEAPPRPNRGPERLPTTEAPRPTPTRGDSAGPGHNGHSDQLTEAEYAHRFHEREQKAATG